nr:hypothetical protein BaRGS_009946 [Batillaria attramentaria]
MLCLITVNVDLIQCIVRRFDPLTARSIKVLSLPHVLWVGVVLARISSLLTVVIAVERCFVVMLPMRFKAWMTQKITWRQDVQHNVSLPYLTLTDFALNNSHFLDVYKNIGLNALFRLVPMATVAVCSALTIVQLRRYRVWWTKTRGAETERMSERDARVSITLGAPEDVGGRGGRISKWRNANASERKDVARRK